MILQVRCSIRMQYNKDSIYKNNIQPTGWILQEHNLFYKDTMQQIKKRVQFTLSERFGYVVQVIYRMHDCSHKRFSACANTWTFTYVHSLQQVATISTKPNAAIQDWSYITE